MALVIVMKQINMALLGLVLLALTACSSHSQRVGLDADALTQQYATEVLLQLPREQLVAAVELQDRRSRHVFPGLDELMTELVDNQVNRTRIATAREQVARVNQSLAGFDIEQQLTMALSQQLSVLDWLGVGEVVSDLGSRSVDTFGPAPVSAEQGYLFLDADYRLSADFTQLQMTLATYWYPRASMRSQSPGYYNRFTYIAPLAQPTTDIDKAASAWSGAGSLQRSSST